MSRELQNTLDRFSKLKKIVSAINTKIISETDDVFVYENANYFTKSFLITACAYLETYLKDILSLLLDSYNEKLRSIAIPYNIVHWSLDTKTNSNAKINSLLGAKKQRFENLSIKIKKKDLDAFVSGNPFKTRELVNMFGIKLESNDVFNNHKERIQMIISKRNNVLHHNDDASDISNQDVLSNIQIIENYITNIDIIITEHT